MISQNYSITRFDADEGKYFEWKEPHFVENEEGEQVQEFLHSKTLFIGHTDSITNYVEVDEAGNITELTEPVIATNVDYEAALSELGVE